MDSRQGDVLQRVSQDVAGSERDLRLRHAGTRLIDPLSATQFVETPVESSNVRGHGPSCELFLQLLALEKCYFGVEVEPRLAYQVSDILKAVIRIRTGVDNYDQGQACLLYT